MADSNASNSATVTQYRDAFQSSTDAGRYDAGQYGKNSYQALINGLEEDAVRNLAERRGARRCLDFACGTGRLTGSLIGQGRDVVGVDISPEMLKIAQEKHPTATFSVVDASVPAETDDGLGTFDLITMFRLILNNEIDISVDCLRWANEHLNDDGVILVNNHGHIPSHKSTASGRRQPSSVTGNVMAHDTVRRMAQSAGLVVLERSGNTLLGQKVCDKLGGVGVKLEKAVVGTPVARYGANQLYILGRP